MSQATTLEKPPAAAGAPTDAMNDWVKDFCGVDPRSYPAAGPSMSGSATAVAAPDPAPAPARPANVPPPLPVMTPDEARKDLERRLTASAAIYDKNGQAVGDDMVPLNKRLTPAEQKIGKVTIERGRDSTTIGEHGPETVATAVDGKDSRTSFDERGITVANKSSLTTAAIGADGKPDEFTRERNDSLNIGLGNVTASAGSKITTSNNGTTTVLAEQRTEAVDLLKGEATSTNLTSRDVKDEKGSRRESEKTTVTKGVSGISSTTETTRQVDKQLDSRSATLGLSRTPGQLGVGYGTTVKSGVMTGPAEAQTMETGTETTKRTGGGLVSDDKGTGVGVNSARSEKQVLGGGKSLTNTSGGGGKVQALVKEVAGSNPPRFSITTTISFDLSLGTTGGKESEASKPLSPTASPDSKVGGEDTHKANASVGLSAAVGGTASFKRDLSQEEAQAYLECIERDGRGGKLPEHQILASGMTQGWDAAHKLWAAMNGSAENVKKLKPGEELESSFQASAGVKAGVGGGETRLGGGAMGAEVGATMTHRIAIKKTGMPDGTIMVTATVDDSTGTSAGLTASNGMANASHSSTHSQGTGRVIVFSLDPDSESFATQLKAIDKAESAAELDELAKDKRFKLVSRTEKDSAADGDTDGAGIGAVNVSVLGNGTIANEKTTDADGHVTSSKSVGTSQVGGAIGLSPDLKIGDSTTESYTGEVLNGQAKSEVSNTHRSTSLGKTLHNLANARHDIIGTVLNPSKLLADVVDSTGTNIDDGETMGIAKLALDETKWNSQVGGMRQDDWVATGKKIRDAIKSSHGEVTDVDKTAVQKALAEWTKSKDGERTEVLDRLLRPFGGPGGKGNGGVAGKGFAFPDGTAQYQPQWAALVIADPLEALKEKMHKDAAGALKDMHAVQKQILALQHGLKDDAAKWAGFEVQHAEMLGHVNTRANEVTTAIHELGKAMVSIAGEPHPPNGAKMRAEIDREAEQQEEAELDIYTNNIDQMKTYAKAVFGKLWQAEEKLKDKSLFSGSGISELLEAAPWIKQAEDQITQWEALYGPTYKLYEKLSPSVHLDKAALEKLHVHGARERWAEVNKLAHKP